MEAGAGAAGVITPEEYILLGRTPDRGGAASLRVLQGFDLVLIEGDKDSGNPKIEVVREGAGRTPVSGEGLLAVVTDLPEVESPAPLFGLEDYRGLACFILEKYFFPETGGLTHLDAAGRPRMVDVSGKVQSLREARAAGEVIMSSSTLGRLREGSMAKGDVLSVAQVAAVMAVKETGRLIPMAHPLPVSGVEVDFKLSEEKSRLEIEVQVKSYGQTGVEMEALTGVSAAALTVYDMCKSVDKEMVISEIKLLEKKGGRSGHYRRGK